MIDIPYVVVTITPPNRVGVLKSVGQVLVLRLDRLFCLRRYCCGCCSVLPTPQDSAATPPAPAIAVASTSPLLSRCCCGWCSVLSRRPRLLLRIPSSRDCCPPPPKLPLICCTPLLSRALLLRPPSCPAPGAGARRACPSSIARV